jgi:hypothetical protein
MLSALVKERFTCYFFFFFLTIASFLPHFGGLNLDVSPGKRQKLPPGHKAWLKKKKKAFYVFDSTNTDMFSQNMSTRW